MPIEENIEKVVLCSVSTSEVKYEKTQEYLRELAFLVETAGYFATKTFIQRLNYPDTKTYVGIGKLTEIKEYLELNELDVVVFDDELSPSQTRNIEHFLNCKIIDRTRLILDIFSQRAQTSYAKTQVELARLQYLLPRLTRLWSHLDRQRGGGITSRGTGETQIETDRRIIGKKISMLKEELKIIDRQKNTQRANRDKFIRVALVGYTNVGKSTIMNLLSKSNVFVENKLFATLDTTVRKVVFNNIPFLLSDTVGFLRKLPHGLIESFKSTLDEIKESDVIIHVVDISNPDFEEHIQVVRQTLSEIGAINKKSVLVFNKIDNYKFIQKDEDDLTPITRENYSLEYLQKTWMSKSQEESVIFISALNKINIQEFRNLIYKEIKELHLKLYPYNNLLYPDIDNV